MKQILLTTLLTFASANTVYQCDLTRIVNIQTDMTDRTLSKDFIRISFTPTLVKYSIINNKLYEYPLYKTGVTTDNIPYTAYQSTNGTILGIYDNLKEGALLLTLTKTFYFRNCTLYK